MISTQVYAPAPAGPTSSLELRAARGRLAEDSAYILTNRSHPTALRRASVTERALYLRLLCKLSARASVTERALRALLDEFTASARPAATRASTAGYV